MIDKIPESIITQVKESDEVARIKHLENVINKKKRRKLFLSRIFCCCKAEEPSTCTKISEIEPNEDAVLRYNKSTDVPIGNIIGPPRWQFVNKICLVVDLDETLVHSTFKVIMNPDYIIPVEIDSRMYSVYVSKRPYAEMFIEEIGKLFECILFTASLAKYADPLANLLDKNRVFQHRLFREACIFKKGFYIKDLQSLGRPLTRLALLDNSPTSYMNQPQNGIPIKSWFGDMKDDELPKLLPHLKYLASCSNVYTCLPIIQKARFNTSTEPIIITSDLVDLNRPSDLNITSPLPSNTFLSSDTVDVNRPIVATNANKNTANSGNNNKIGGLNEITSSNNNSSTNLGNDLGCSLNENNKNNFDVFDCGNVGNAQVGSKMQIHEHGSNNISNLENIFSISEFHKRDCNIDIKVNNNKCVKFSLKNHHFIPEKHKNLANKKTSSVKSCVPNDNNNPTFNAKQQVNKKHHHTTQQHVKEQQQQQININQQQQHSQIPVKPYLKHQQKALLKHIQQKSQLQDKNQQCGCHDNQQNNATFMHDNMNKKILATTTTSTTTASNLINVNVNNFNKMNINFDDRQNNNINISHNNNHNINTEINNNSITVGNHNLIIDIVNNNNNNYFNNIYNISDSNLNCSYNNNFNNENTNSNNNLLSLPAKTNISRTY